MIGFARGFSRLDSVKRACYHDSVMKESWANRGSRTGVEVAPVSSAAVVPRAEPAAEIGAATELQSTLVELIDLSLIAKQAHWNVSGPLFRPLHLHFDEIADEARGWADDVAERLEAVGVAADGRVASVAAGSGLPAMPEGKLEGAAAAGLVSDRLDRIAERVRQRVERLDGGDALSQDVLIEVGRGLEKQVWMLREQVV